MAVIVSDLTRETRSTLLRFSPNFAAWVFFYGPEGGEASRVPGA
jgi:hypothetical protein